MAYEFRLPDIGEGVAEGEVVQWFVQEGAVVAEDAPLVSVLTDKANVEIPSPKAGRIVKLHAAVGEKVKVGGLLVTIEPSGSSPSAPSPAPSASPPAAAPSTPPAAAASVSAPGASGAAPRIVATPMVRRLAAERGIDLATIQGSGPGGRIVEADLANPVPRPATVAPPPPPPPASVPAPAPPVAPRVPGAAPAAPGAAAPPAATGDGERIPLRGVRRVIADHMAHSVHTAAHFTYVEEVDVTELVRLRERMAKHVEKHGAKLSYLPFIIKGVVAGLRQHPWMNATMDDARQELVVHKEYHIGIATAAPEGLVVPVIRNAERKSVAQLAKEIQDLAERARAGKLSRNELTGSTFTITSLGALGGVLATPILNYPEVAILGVHRIVRRPIYNPEGSVVPAQLMNLSVSLDHRVL
ncbi:MAG TPA: dihydrolipoamide acetyltransferase family protein, partial [Thermoplasmata archaeon]|nr:dihydrolipoamide acetyltransferase family protein [Thermoplasmata archaeon]